MGFIDSITEYITNENRRLSSKAAFIIVIIIGIFMIDNLVGFSFHYQKERKIEELQKLNALIKDSASDSTTKNYAKAMREEIFKRKNLYDYTALFFRNISSKGDKSEKKVKPTETAIKNDSTVKINFWKYMSSGGLYFLLAIVILPLIMFTDKKNTPIVRITSSIIASIMMLITAFFFTWLFDLIPQISNKTPVWNYILNFMLQLSILGLLIYATVFKKTY